MTKESLKQEVTAIAKQEEIYDKLCSLGFNMDESSYINDGEKIKIKMERWVP